VVLNPGEADEWDEFSDRILAETQRLRNVRGLTPYDHPDSHLKREVYRFVCRYLDEGNTKQLNRILEANRVILPRFPTFRENPFHWALSVLRDPKSDNIKKYQVSRFGRQLIYAKRHKIPPELLIGFLYQSGGPDVVASKAADATKLEDWTSSYFNWLNDN
jgi:hypothetical protein